jgi:hypothetical protein
VRFDGVVPPLWFTESQLPPDVVVGTAFRTRPGLLEPALVLATVTVWLAGAVPAIVKLNVGTVPGVATSTGCAETVRLTVTVTGATFGVVEPIVRT